MNKVLHIFTIASCITLHSISMNAMDPAPVQKPTYSLVRIISPKFISDVITFVKYIYDQFHNCHYVVVLDRRGPCELFPVNGNNQRVKRFRSLKPLSVSDMFFYQDHDQETLLISFDKNGKELYVWNYDSIDYCRTIQVGHNFSLHQKPDNTLIMHNTDDEFFSEINLKYAKIQAEYEFPKTVLSQNPLRDVKKLFVRDEGLIVGSDDLRRDEVSLHLSRKMFDLTLLADEQRQRLTGTRSNKLRPITCYHKTYTGEIILGHDGGIVSIWKPIKEEAS